jgi:hypothetical protein
MNHAFERRHRYADLLYGPHYIVQPSHIAARIDHLDSVAAQPFNVPPGSVVTRTSTSEQD